MYSIGLGPKAERRARQAAVEALEWQTQVQAQAHHPPAELVQTIPSRPLWASGSTSVKWGVHNTPSQGSLGFYHHDPEASCWGVSVSRDVHLATGSGQAVFMPKDKPGLLGKSLKENQRNPPLPDSSKNENIWISTDHLRRQMTCFRGEPEHNCHDYRKNSLM